MLRRRIALYNGSYSTIYFVDIRLFWVEDKFTIAGEANQLSSSSAVLKNELLKPVAKYKK